jgi:hypothetical protein
MRPPVPPQPRRRSHLLTTQTATRCLYPHMTRDEFVPLFMIARMRTMRATRTRCASARSSHMVWLSTALGKPRQAPDATGAAQRGLNIA